MALLLTREATSLQKKCVTTGSCPCNSLFYHMPHYSEVPGTIDYGRPYCWDKTPWNDGVLFYKMWYMLWITDQLSQCAQAGITKYHRLASSNHKNLLSYNSRGYSIQDQGFNRPWFLVKAVFLASRWPPSTVPSNVEKKRYLASLLLS